MLLRLKFVKLSLLISMCKENVNAKMEKLEAQICRCTKLCPEWEQKLNRIKLSTGDEQETGLGSENLRNDVFFLALANLYSLFC